MTERQSQICPMWDGKRHAAIQRCASVRAGCPCNGPWRRWQRKLYVALSMTTLLAPCVAAEPTDDELLKQVPAAEQSLKDQADHWGLPFSEQLRRFVAARDEWRRSLGPQAPHGFIVGTVHSLEKVPRNKYWFKGRYGTSMSLEAARNEYESFQVAVLPDVGRTCRRVTLTAEDLQLDGGQATIPRGQVTIYRVGYVQTNRARYPSLYTGPWPDPLLPNGALEITGSDLGLFWVEVHVPRNAAPGRYHGRLRLDVDGISTSIQVSLLVHAFALPDRVPWPITVWTIPQWPSGERMMPADYRLLLGELLAHGIDPLSVGKDFVDLRSDDFRTLDENLEFCLARGQQMFEIPNGGDKPAQLKPLVQHLRKKGWLSKAVVYSNQDEPSESQLESHNIPFHRQIRSLYPDLRVFLASQYFPRIDEACDIWVTDVSTGRGAAFAGEHHGAASLWFYYCHMPLHADFARPLVEAPNMELDNEAIEHRLTLWLAWKYQTTGMFIWSGNNEWIAKDVDRTDWQKTGWKLSDRPYPYPLGGVHNGNGYLIYPGPVPSIRLKLLRDGLEDYGYLTELKKRAAITKDPELKKQATVLLAVPPNVLMGPHYFNRDPAALLSARTTIASLIDAMRQKDVAP